MLSSIEIFPQQILNLGFIHNPSCYYFLLLLFFNHDVGCIDLFFFQFTCLYLFYSFDSGLFFITKLDGWYTNWYQQDQYWSIPPIILCVFCYHSWLASKIVFKCTYLFPYFFPYFLSYFPFLRFFNIHHNTIIIIYTLLKAMDI